DRVVQTEEDALFRVNPEIANKMGKTAGALGELGIAVLAAIVDEGRFGATPCREVALDQVGSGIVCARALAAHRPSSPNRIVGRDPSRSACGRLYFGYAAVEQQRSRARRVSVPARRAGARRTRPARNDTQDPGARFRTVGALPRAARKWQRQSFDQI